jgi:hypothetical protein
MALHHYWTPIRGHNLSLTGSALPRDSNGAVHAAHTEATRREDDTLLRVVLDARLSVRAVADATVGITDGWFTLSEAAIVLGVQADASFTEWPFLTGDQSIILGEMSMDMRALIDPKDLKTGHAWYQTGQTLSFSGQRKGTGNPGEFQQVRVSLFWGTVELVDQTPGYTNFEWEYTVRGRALWGSTSL